MAESVLYTDRAARAEAVGLRHGKHSSLPKRVAASHSLRQQQMRHTHTHKLKGLTHFFFFFHTEKRPCTDVYAPRRLPSQESRKRMNSQKRRTATTCDEFSRCVQKRVVLRKKEKKEVAFELQHV